MLTEDEKKDLAGIVVAAMSPLPAPPMSLGERLSVANTMWKWVAGSISAILAVYMIVQQVRTNTVILRDISPKTRVMWWMKENGYTNQEVQPNGPVKVPDFN